MSTASKLDAATQDRKARLAQLKSLKRKQPPTDDVPAEAFDADADDAARQELSSDARFSNETSSWLSGRNYDPQTRGPRLGFENAPSAGHSTLESQAKELAIDAKRQAADEEQADNPLDLFKLQPKKPNWDLKRDLTKKLEVLNVRTDNAIAKLVRERIAKAQKDAEIKSRDEDTGDVAGIQGAALVGAMHEREREAQLEREEEEGQEDIDEEEEG